MARVTKPQIRAYLREHVGIVELAEELGARLRRAGPHRATAVCINPAHKDSEDGGGSLSISITHRRWQCFGNCRPGVRNKTEGDVFDLWALAQGLSPLEPNYGNKTLEGLAALRESLLDSNLVGWRDAMRGRGGGNILTSWRRTLDCLSPWSLPAWAVDVDRAALPAWQITDLGPVRNLLVACGAGRLRVEQAGPPLLVVGFQRLDLLGIFTPRLKWLAGVSAARCPRCEDFAIRTRHEWLVTGQELCGVVPSVAPPYRPLQVVVVVESPLDYVALDRVQLPAVLGRWQPGALSRIRSLPVPGRILCLAAAMVGDGDVPERLCAVLQQGDVDWVPRCLDFSDVPTLACLTAPNRAVATRLAASVVPAGP